MSDRISKVTILDIARELNITAATVSRALNDHPGIKETTKKAVKETATRLNYKHNKIASSLRLGKSSIIGVIIPSAEINFFGSVVHGIEKVANENNYTVLIYQSNELYEYEKKGVQTFLQSRVDGVLASISKETINLDQIKFVGYAFQIEMKFAAWKLGFKIKEVPIIFEDRKFGVSKMNKGIVKEGILGVLNLRWQSLFKNYRNRVKNDIVAVRNLVESK